MERRGTRMSHECQILAPAPTGYLFLIITGFPRPRGPANEPERTISPGGFAKDHHRATESPAT